MIPLIIAGLTALIVAALVDAFSNDPELKDIRREDIIDTHLRDASKYESEIILKRSISRAIPVIIRKHNQFKIGKTGEPNNRQAAHRYSLMYVLCESKDPDLIERLENYYIQKYIDDPKNQNLKAGSAGKSKSVKGKYYLYVVVN